MRLIEVWIPLYKDDNCVGNWHVLVDKNYNRRNWTNDELKQMMKNPNREFTRIRVTEIVECPLQ